MALIKCPECNKEISSSALSCPHCGYPINSNASNESYETQVVKIRCWGRSSNAINSKLEPYTKAGWEVVTMVEDHWLGGLASPVYKVTMKRLKKASSSTGSAPKQPNYFPKTRPIDSSKFWKCPTCGTLNSLVDEYCSKCLTEKPNN